MTIGSTSVMTSVCVVSSQLYDNSLVFWLIFFVVYTSFMFLFSLEFYYRWQLKPRWYSVKALLVMYRRDGLWPPKQIVINCYCWVRLHDVM